MFIHCRPTIHGRFLSTVAPLFVSCLRRKAGPALRPVIGCRVSRRRSVSNLRCSRDSCAALSCKPGTCQQGGSMLDSRVLVVLLVLTESVCGSGSGSGSAWGRAVRFGCGVGAVTAGAVRSPRGGGSIASCVLGMSGKVEGGRQHAQTHAKTRIGAGERAYIS